MYIDNKNRFCVKTNPDLFSQVSYATMGKIYFFHGFNIFWWYFLYVLSINQINTRL